MSAMRSSLIVFCILSFGSPAFASGVTKESLINLETGAVEKIKETEVFGERSGIRQKSIRESAIQVGAQYGYIEKIDHIQDVIEEKEEYIDKVYNFPYLMSMSSDSSAEMYLIPPIVHEYNDIKVLDHEKNSLTVIENKYVITKPARLVTTPLDWRQYLRFMPRAEGIELHQSLIPENDEEKRIWAKGIQEGWKEGEQVAEREMLRRMEKLAEDYRGIIRFNRLADEGYFTRPKLIETRVPVSGNSKELVQNKTVYTIVAESSANIDDSKWEARVLDNRESMIFPSEYSNIELRINTR